MNTPNLSSLDDLKQRFDNARAIAKYGVATTPEHGLPGKEWCPFCGKWWRKWAGSVLEGHAACVVPPLFKDELKKFAASRADLGYQEIAKALGVSLAVLRSWCSPIRR